MRIRYKQKKYYKEINDLSIGDIISFGEITTEYLVIENKNSDYKYELLNIENNIVEYVFSTFDELKKYISDLWHLKIIDSNDVYIDIIWK